MEKVCYVEMVVPNIGCVIPTDFELNGPISWPKYLYCGFGWNYCSPITHNVDLCVPVMLVLLMWLKTLNTGNCH
jgi:hypothetical protein